VVPAATAGQGAAPAAPPAAEAGQKPDPALPPPPGAGYSYDPAGRRDPFVSRTPRGADVPAAAGQRPSGLSGLLIGEVTVKGTFKSKGGFLALLQAADGRTYTVKQGDKVFDGAVKTITTDTVVFSQDVNDPLSLVKQREVRKSIRPEGR
jgi:Tfp pilus assembly protein PilP